MKEHLKKHKIKEQHKKKEFYLLLDIEQGFYRSKKAGHYYIDYCEKICEAMKINTKEQAVKELVKIAETNSSEALYLVAAHSTDEKALFLEKLLKEKQFNEV